MTSCPEGTPKSQFNFQNNSILSSSNTNDVILSDRYLFNIINNIKPFLKYVYVVVIPCNVNENVNEVNFIEKCIFKQKIYNTFSCIILVTQSFYGYPFFKS